MKEAVAVHVTKCPECGSSSTKMLTMSRWFCRDCWAEWRRDNGAKDARHIVRCAGCRRILARPKFDTLHGGRWSPYHSVIAMYIRSELGGVCRFCGRKLGEKANLDCVKPR